MCSIRLVSLEEFDMFKIAGSTTLAIVALLVVLEIAANAGRYGFTLDALLALVN